MRALRSSFRQDRGVHRRSGPRGDPQIVACDARGPAAPAQPGAAGLVCLLPLRRVQGDLRLPRPVHLAPGGPLDPQTTQPHEVAIPCAATFARGGPPRRVTLFVPQRVAVSIPLPGRQHRHTPGERDTGISRVARRRGLVESRMRADARTSGSAGGLGNVTPAKASSAPKPDPTHPPESTTAFSGGSRYRPTTSQIFASSSGSVGNLNVSRRHSCGPHRFHAVATV